MQDLAIFFSSRFYPFPNTKYLRFPMIKILVLAFTDEVI